MRPLFVLAAILTLNSCALPGARPMDFACADTDLADAWQTYRTAAIQRQIQQDAYPPQHGSTDVNRNLSGRLDGAAASPNDFILRALREATHGDLVALVSRPRSTNVLMLSGGAGWGAYGAGFLQQSHRDHPDLRWGLITGVSTGALQALRVALGEYDALVTDYTIDHESDLAVGKGLLGVLRGGYMYDASPLRNKLERMLCEQDCRRLRELAAGTTPTVLIGTVDMRSGDFKVLNVKTLLRRVYYLGEVEIKHPDPARVGRAAQCVVGAAMASAAVPVFLRPVRLGGPDPDSYRTYADGGVRLSLFDAQLARSASALAALDKSDVTLFALRNGPTIVRPAGDEPGSASAKIDSRPDALTMALRSYSIIVNQAEVTSIAGLRLVNRAGTIKYTSADGYDWKDRPCRKVSEIAAAEGRPPVKQPMFDPQFMKCLIRWGREKEHARGWIELDRADRPALHASMEREQP